MKQDWFTQILGTFYLGLILSRTETECVSSQHALLVK